MKIVLLITCLVLSTISIHADMPAPGEEAPAFSGMKHDGYPISLSDYDGKWLALYFYPKSDTPGCTRQACSLRDSISELSDKGINILGVSVNSVADQAAFREKYNLPFPLLADEDAEVAEAYGVKRGLLPMSKRVTFLISPEGNIGAVIEAVDVDSHAAQVMSTYQELAGKE